MKNSLLKGFLVLLTSVCSTIGYSQNVSGVVSDNRGTLNGVSVTVKGTKNGTSTEADGSYTLKNIGSNATLLFSYIGMKSKSVDVNGQSVLNVTLEDEGSDLKEVVVIGYGTVRKKDATGAVDQLNSKKFDNVSAGSPGELLRGKMAGVQVTSSSGEPGAGLAIRVRGNSSLRSGNNPLIIVDGVPLDGGDTSAGGSQFLGTSSARSPLNFVNQNDIESISVLKDASATAIYGSRGSNGVIIITTKKGKSKEPQLNFNTSVGFSSYASDFDVMSAQQFASKLPVGSANDYGSRSYNWKDVILRDAISQNYDLSYSIGTDNSNTRLSFGMNTTEGIVKNSGLNKYTASFSNSTNFFDSVLKIDSKILYAGLRDTAALTTNNAGYIGNQIATALYWNPTRPINTSTGAFTTVGDDYVNPAHLLKAYDDYANTNKLIGNITSSLKITSNLKYQFLFGVETSGSERKRQLDPTINIKDIAQISDPENGNITKFGFAQISNVNRFNTTFEHTLNYTAVLTKNIAMDAILGYSYYNYNFNQNTTEGKGFVPAQDNLIDNIQGGVATGFRAESFRNQVELQSFFGRANFTMYKDFLLTLTVRRDGGSKLGANNKYGTFPSIGLGYKVFEDKTGAVNSLKIRANYGVTGNQEFDPNSALRRGRYGNNGRIQDQINANPDLTWETTSSFGVGTDFTLLNSKLTGSIDYFVRRTQDLIFAQPTAATQPAPSSLKFVNLPGILENKGFEFGLSYKIIDIEKLTWDFGINGSVLANKIKDFSGYIATGQLDGQGLSGATSQVIADGLPAYTYFIYDFQGYDASGNSIYTDSAGNPAGLGTASKVLLDKQPLPKFNLGFNTAFTYKNIDAAVSFYGAFGHYIYNNTNNALFYKGAFPVRNITDAVASSTQVEGDPNSPSTKYLEKGDFLRMGNLTFGYTFEGGIFDRAKIKSARFFVNGQNLLLFTDYTGFDPEVDTDKKLNGVPSAGIDYLAYPRAKTLSFGLNLNF